MKAVFRVSFDHNLPVWLDARGRNLVRVASWLEPVGAGTVDALVLIEADAAVLGRIRARSGWEWVEDLAVGD